MRQGSSPYLESTNMDETTLGFDGEHCECCANARMQAYLLSNTLNEKPPTVGRARTYHLVNLLNTCKSIADAISGFFGGLVTYHYEVYRIEKHYAGAQELNSLWFADPTQPIVDDELPDLQDDKSLLVEQDELKDIDWEALANDWDDKF